MYIETCVQRPPLELARKQNKQRPSDRQQTFDWLVESRIKYIVVEYRYTSMGKILYLFFCYLLNCFYVFLGVVPVAATIVDSRIVCIWNLFPDRLGQMRKMLFLASQGLFTSLLYKYLLYHCPLNNTNALPYSFNLEMCIGVNFALSLSTGR